MGPRLPGDRGPTARPDKPKSLTHNPFAALAAKVEAERAAPVSEQQPEAPPPETPVETASEAAPETTQASAPVAAPEAPPPAPPVEATPSPAGGDPAA